MCKVAVNYLVSDNDNTKNLRESNRAIMQRVEQTTGVKIDEVDKRDLRKYSINFLFVEGGGVETKFLKNFKYYQEPIYLIATEKNNSLAASMEILSFMNQHHFQGKILHGSDDYLVNEISNIIRIFKTKLFLYGLKIARIGKPSDWLIASDVDKKELQKKNGVEIVDIDIKTFIKEIQKQSYVEDAYTYAFKQLNFDPSEKEKALYVYGALMRIVQKEQLNGLTIRCFDLLGSLGCTSCVALSLLNAQNIHAACEGDVPSLLSMAIAQHITEQPVFQANPSAIDVKHNQIIFAHCTLPFNMPRRITLDTHYESGIGVALKGDLEIGDATIFKANGMLNKAYISPAKIINNLDKKDLCRTQILLQPEEGVSYFTERPIGNHHIIINGDYAKLLEDFMKEL